MVILVARLTSCFPLSLKRNKTGLLWSGRLNPQQEFGFAHMEASMPLYTGAFSEAYYFGGAFWGILLEILLVIYGFQLNILQWFLITMFVGFLIQLLLNGLKMRRFSNPVTNQELLDLFEEVKNDTGKGDGIQLWFRDVDRTLLLSTVNPLFKAILLSESTIVDILSKRESGKILLAHEVLKMERVRPLSRLTLALLGFTFFSFFESIFLNPPVPLAFSLVTLTITIAIVLILVGLSITPYLSNRKSGNVDRQIEDLYNVPLSAAKNEVLVGIPVPDKTIEEFRSDDREVERILNTHASRNGLIAALTVAPIAFIITYVLVGGSPLFFSLVVVVTVLSAIAAFGIVFIYVDFVTFRRVLAKKRNTAWDIQNAYSDYIQGFLNSFSGYEHLMVRAVKSSTSDQFGLVVLELKSNLQEEVLIGLLPQIVNDISDAQLASPFLLSEIRRNDIEKRYNRFGYIITGIGFPFIVISAFYVILRFGIMFDTNWFILVMMVDVILMMISLILLTAWKRNAETKSDVEIARSYPRFREALHTLIAKHHTLPYGKTSYRTRLQRVEQKLGYTRESFAREAGVELE